RGIVACHEPARHRHPSQHLARQARRTVCADGPRGRERDRLEGLCAAMNVVIAAGGTGGHLYPAVSLAQEFFRQRAAASVLFVGTSRGLERKVLAHEGLELETIEAQPVMGGGLTKALSGIAALPRAVHQAMGILKRQGANLVMGIGGYTSPPVILAAALLRIPRVILEPNARPGVANRVVGPVVNLVFLGFDSAAGYFSRAKVRVVGTPIRRAFFENIDT